MISPEILAVTSQDDIVIVTLRSAVFFSIYIIHFQTYESVANLR